MDEVAKVGGITSRHASTADDEAPPSPITMETDTPVIDTQFTSPQPMPSAANLNASPMIPRTSPQAPSSVNVPSPFSASPNVNSPGTIYGVGSPGEFVVIFVFFDSFLSGRAERMCVVLVFVKLPVNVQGIVRFRYRFLYRIASVWYAAATYQASLVRP